MSTIPFKSKAQARWMWANKPRTARKWTKKYGGWKNLPNRSRKKKKR